MQNANSDSSISPNKNHYIPYYINNKNNALMNKYNKYKIDKSYSPVGKQQPYDLKKYDYYKLYKNQKLPIIPKQTT